MKFVAGGINGVYLRDIFDQMPDDVSIVKAAVAYASSTDLLDICKNKNIPMILYGRIDPTCPVNTKVLRSFLESGVNYECKLVKDYFHPKVIWAENYGIYIGSANMTDRAWWNNIECGVWFDENEIELQNLTIDLISFFDEIEKQSNPLTQELFSKLSKIQTNQDYNEALTEQDNLFNKNVAPLLGNNFEGLIRVSRINSTNKQKESFLREWNDTLTILRKIGDVLTSKGNNPHWCRSNAKKGVVTDQFLHSFYYNQVRQGTRSCHIDFNKTNSSNPNAALLKYVDWWKSLNEAPTGEDNYINEYAPFLNNLLGKNNILGIDLPSFIKMMSYVHSFRTMARQTPNSELGLPENTKLSHDERIKVVAEWIWSKKTPAGLNILELLNNIIYSGSFANLPLRVWESCNNKDLHIPRFGLSCIGEIVGWALPDDFPPRNNRTSKALFALGFSNVKIYGGE